MTMMTIYPIKVMPQIEEPSRGYHLDVENAISRIQEMDISADQDNNIFIVAVARPVVLFEMMIPISNKDVKG
jgi:hypothetical protein